MKCKMPTFFRPKRIYWFAETYNFFLATRLEKLISGWSKQIFNYSTYAMLYIIKKCSAAFDQSHSRHLINGSDLTWGKQASVLPPLYFNLPSSPRLSLVFCPPYPLQNEWHRCCWTRQYPLVPFPLLLAQHEVWNLFFDHCPPLPKLSLCGRKKDPGRREMGRPGAAKLKREGRGAHSHVSGIWRKHSPNNKWSVGHMLHM